MKDNKRNINLAVMLSLLTAFILSAGCATTKQPIVGKATLPTTAKDDAGAEYHLLGCASVTQMVDGENEKLDAEQLLIESLQVRYPNNPELIAHLNTVSRHLHEAAGLSLQNLNGIKDDLAKTGGTLYFYKRLNGKDVEHGLASISKGHVIKKFMVTTTITPDTAAH